MHGTPYDIAVIGGGINGVGIARDAAGRGARVVLVEQNDLASATSSASTKLIHGGLRYLENYEFGMVRDSLRERSILLQAAPHLVRPIPFVLPHQKGLRPKWMIRAGLFLYDHLAGRGGVPASRFTDLAGPEGAPLLDSFHDGFIYYDCQVDDARLVIANALDAKARGADFYTYTKCLSAMRSEDVWNLSLDGKHPSTQVQARVLVNATGPWAESFLTGYLHQEPKGHLRLAKGSHLVLPKLYDGDHAYLLQHPDGRVVFVIPYYDDFSLVGTTDVPFRGDPAVASVTDEEVAYLVDIVGRFFRQPMQPEQAVWRFSGVRPLYDDGGENISSISRDYVFEMDDKGPPLLSVFGGKLTSYRGLAEKAVNKLASFLKVAPKGWTESAALPGGEGDPDLLSAYLEAEMGFVDGATRRRWLHTYGGQVPAIFSGVRSTADMGQEILPGLFEAELDHMCRQEYACTAEDVLWRRSKLGLVATAEQEKQLADWLARHPGL